MVLAGALPLLLACPIPLQDWPNHIAGAHVLARLLDGDPFWARFYRFNTFLVPNAAVDLGLLGLRAAHVPGPLAANLFVLVTYAVFVGGLIGLSRALGTTDATKPALAVLLFYGAALFWGLINYVLAVGLMWGLLAFWLAAERRGVWKLCVAGCGAACLLFVHVVPAVVFALLLACFDASRWRQGARLRSCASSPVALAVSVTILRCLPGNTGHDLSAVYSGTGVAGFILWKLRLFAVLPFGGSLLQDGASLIAWAGTLAAIMATARVRVAAGAAFGVVALVLLTLAVPERLGTGTLLDARLAGLPVMLAAMGVRLHWRGSRAARACAAALALLVAGRSVVIAAEWHRAAKIFTAFSTHTAALPAGSILVKAYGRPLDSLSWTDIWSPPILSIGAQVVEHGIFYPALFANPDQQPIARRPEFDAIALPWNFSDPEHRRRSLAALATLCPGSGSAAAYSGVFVTVLYTGPPFVIVDACAPGRE